MKTYKFITTKFNKVGETCKFNAECLFASGETVEEAYLKIEGKIPEGKRIFMWYEVENEE